MRLILLLLGCLFSVGCRLGVVEEARVYRSPQLRTEDLEQLIKRLKIKTVINLRGASQQDWFQKQSHLLSELGVASVDIGMSARRLPHRSDLIKLLDAFQTVQYPILIHCKAGVDRTGEAAAIYQMVMMGKSKAEALEMLTESYGHFTNRFPAKRYFIEQVWQDELWARKDYDPCTQDYNYYNKQNSHCIGQGTGSVEDPLDIEEDEEAF